MPKIAMAATMPGIRIGSIMVTCAVAENRARRPRIPSAARVPSTVAMTPTTTATPRLVRSDPSQRWSLKKFSYHCRDQPSMGNAKLRLSLNESGTTMSVGATSSSAATAAHSLMGRRMRVGSFIGGHLRSPSG
ncbi:hypothetical protein [Leucobacter soli]|uniref:hypothetical protein n=1 Tax=Leucobacter soli TaxID=2812850 RepID=UPI00360C4B27